MTYKVLILIALVCCLVSCSVTDEPHITTCGSDFVPGYRSGIYEDLDLIREGPTTADEVFGRIRNHICSDYKRGVWMMYMSDILSSDSRTVVYQCVALLCHIKDTGIKFSVYGEFTTTILLDDKSDPDGYSNLQPLFEWLDSQTPSTLFHLPYEAKWLLVYAQNTEKNPNYFEYRIEILLNEIDESKSPHIALPQVRNEY